MDPKAEQDLRAASPPRAARVVKTAPPAPMVKPAGTAPKKPQPATSPNKVQQARPPRRGGAPEDAPSQQAARQLSADKASQDAAFGTTFKDDVLKNVVSYEDNVKSVLTKVVLGEADAGIVYLTDISLDNAGKVGRLDIPDALNAIATYPIASVSDATQPDLARAFVDLVLSDQGQAILAKYGFLPAD